MTFTPLEVIDGLLFVLNAEWFGGGSGTFAIMAVVTFLIAIGLFFAGRLMRWLAVGLSLLMMILAVQATGADNPIPYWGAMIFSPIFFAGIAAAVVAFFWRKNTPI